MAIANTASSVAAGRTLTVPIAASGNNRSLVIAYHQRRSPLNMGTVLFDGGGVGTAVLTVATTDLEIRFFHLNDAALPSSAASYDITVSGGLTGSASERLSYFYCEGADQSGPSDTASSTSSVNTEISLTLESAASGAWCVGSLAGVTSTTTHTPGTDVTEAADQSITTATTSRAWDGHSVLTNVIALTPSATGTRVIGALSIDPAAGGGAAEITSVTGPASAANTVMATESFTIAGTGFEAAQGAGTVTIGGVACTVTAWGDTSITATGPAAGLMFGGSKTITVTPDSNTADSITGQSYLPETGYDYVTYDGSTVVANSVFWDGDSAVTGLATGDQAWFLSTATRVGGSETCDFVPADGTGVVTLENVTEPGDYENEEVYLRDASDGADSAAYTVVVDTTAPAGYTVSWDQASIDDTNHEAASFTFAGAEVGATYEYTITSSGGGTPVTDTGTISTATDQITGIDVSGLNDGTLTLSVTLTDTVGLEGAAATDTVNKDAIEGDTLTTSTRLHIGIGIFI